MLCFICFGDETAAARGEDALAVGIEAREQYERLGNSSHQQVSPDLVFQIADYLGCPYCQSCLEIVACSFFCHEQATQATPSASYSAFGSTLDSRRLLRQGFSIQ